MNDVDDLNMEAHGELDCVPGMTQSESILAKSLERVAAEGCDMAVVLIINKGQLDVLVSNSVGHEVLAGLFGGLAESHRQAAIDEQANQPPEIHH